MKTILSTDDYYTYTSIPFTLHFLPLNPYRREEHLWPRKVFWQPSALQYTSLIYEVLFSVLNLMPLCSLLPKLPCKWDAALETLLLWLQIQRFLTFGNNWLEFRICPPVQLSSFFFTHFLKDIIKCPFRWPWFWFFTSILSLLSSRAWVSSATRGLIIKKLFSFPPVSLNLTRVSKASSTSKQCTISLKFAILSFNILGQTVWVCIGPLSSQNGSIQIHTVWPRILKLNIAMCRISSLRSLFTD